MADDPEFDRTAPASGRLESVSPLIRRLVAGNGGPFTFTGTCTYIVGHGNVAVIDPGPDDTAHRAALLEALGSERVTHIVVTHTHRDHSPGARALQEACGGIIVGCAPHRAARPLAPGEANVLDASADHDHAPQAVMGEGDVVSGPGWRLIAVETPGHTANHLSFALPEEQALFSGDHVMAWSTSIVAPPDGAMGDYMASLEKLRQREDRIYWPGHGGPVRDPSRLVRGMYQHRRQREASILRRLAAGDSTIPEIVDAIYEALDPGLKGAAALSVLAHLEDLAARDLVATDGLAGLGATFVPRG